MRPIDKSRWPLLSPLLDELLDLDAAAQAQRLQALRGQDAELADDLQELLSRQAAMEKSPFLESPALPRPQVEAGQTVGAYTLEREIGQGGMGTVWLARRTDGRFEGQVAIKFLSIHLLGPTQAQSDGGRFAREGQILARLTHPHIARLLDAGMVPSVGQPYLVLEYVDGLPITAYCEQLALDVPARVRLFQSVLAAVAHAHNRLILHRDLKPSNILVNRSGEVKLLDFGVAKLLNDSAQTQASELTQQVGRSFTPQYAAPEQVQGDEVSTATDVYALGVLLFLLLSGEHPTAKAATQTTPLDRLRAIVETEPRRPSEQAAGNTALPPSERQRRRRELLGDLDTIVAKALKKLPAERYANAADLAEDLRRWQAHEPITARPDSRLYQLSKFVRRHRLAVAAGSVAALVLASLTVLSVSEAWRADRAEGVARQRSAQSDDLVGYMLGEFADKLRPIGRLELLDSVGGKALAHLSMEGNEQLGPQARLQRAKALTVIGEVRVSKRDLDAAVEPLQAARALLQGDPPEQALLAPWRKAQGAADFWLGHVYYTRRQFSLAKSHMQAYRDRSAQWLQATPQDLEAVTELSYAENSLGSLLLDQGDLAAAEQAFQQSIALKRRVLKERPQDIRLSAELSDSTSWLGSSLMRHGRYRAAGEQFKEALAQIVSLRLQAPDDLGWLGKEANTLNNLGLAALKQDDAKAAQLHFQAAAQAFRRLGNADPVNKMWGFGRIRASIGLIQSDQSGAPRAQAGAAALADDLASLDGQKPLPRWLPFRAELAVLQARDLARQGQRPQAEQTVRAAQTLLEPAWQQSPGDIALLVAKLDLMLALGDPALGIADESGRKSQCQAALNVIAENGAKLVKVHADLTRQWGLAHQCLSHTAEMQEARQWLLAQQMTP